MIFKNCDGIMPAQPEKPAAEDQALLASVDGLLDGSPAY